MDDQHLEYTPTLAVESTGNNAVGTVAIDRRDACLAEAFSAQFQRTFPDVESRISALNLYAEHLRLAFSAGAAASETIRACGSEVLAEECERFVNELAASWAPASDDAETARALSVMRRAPIFFIAGAQAATRYSSQHQDHKP